MRTYTLGDGPPEVAVVGGIHGDEPCGVRAVERLVADDPAVERPVKLVVANERAVETGVRYVDTDLNRAFDDDDDDGHEARLARGLAAELRGMTTLSLHSTQSYAAPIGIVNGATGRARDVVSRLPVDAVVDVGAPEGRPFAIDATPLVEAECGLQGTAEAADSAERLARAFLAATDALPPAPEPRSRPAFRLGDSISKPPAERYEVHADNFQRVEPGETYATADGRSLVADEPFYPVLFSAEGYEDIFGYVAERVGEVGP